VRGMEDKAGRTCEIDLSSATVRELSSGLESVKCCNATSDLQLEMTVVQNESHKLSVSLRY
jgi:hypothetical protein